MEKTLTYAERATWGDCPVCEAKHGEYCNRWVGVSLGTTAHGTPPKNGVHLGRLQKAPTKVKLVPVD